MLKKITDIEKKKPKNKTIGKKNGANTFSVVFVLLKESHIVSCVYI